MQNPENSIWKFLPSWTDLGPSQPKSVPINTREILLIKFLDIFLGSTKIFKISLSNFCKTPNVIVIILLFYYEYYYHSTINIIILLSLVHLKLLLQKKMQTLNPPYPPSHIFKKKFEIITSFTFS